MCGIKNTLVSLVEEQTHSFISLNISWTLGTIMNFYKHSGFREASECLCFNLAGTHLLDLSSTDLKYVAVIRAGAQISALKCTSCVTWLLIL